MVRAGGAAAEHLLGYLAELSLREPPSAPVLRPDVEDAHSYDNAAQREEADLANGAVLKATVSEGSGDSSPGTGDLVLVHYVCRRCDQAVVAASRREHGGCGAPLPFLLGGKGRRAPRAWELCVEQMKAGEVCVITTTPAYGYGHSDCGLSRPAGVGAEEKVEFELHLLRWYPAQECCALGLTPAATDGSIFKWVSVEGSGWEKPREPFEVVINCTMRWPHDDGELGKGEILLTGGPMTSLEVTVGAGQVGPHLEAALCSMLKGETAFFLCPLDTGNDARHWKVPATPVGQHTVVEYEVSLLHIVQVRDMTGDGGVTKRRVRDGEGEFPVDCPLEDCAVRVHYKLTVEGELIYDTRGNGAAEFTLGDGAFPPGMEMAVRLMTVKEVSIVRAKANYAYDAFGLSEKAVPVSVAPGQSVEWEIELLDFDKAPNWHPMCAAERIPLIEDMKQAANKLFGEQRYSFAKAKYQKALKVVNHTFDATTEDEQEAILNLRLALQLNLAAVLHKEGDFSGALSWCNKVLQEDADNAKATFRRGNAFLEMGEYGQAIEDYTRYGDLEQVSRAHAEQLIATAKRRQAAANARQREELKGFMGGPKHKGESRK